MKVLHVLHHSLPSPVDGYAIRSHSILRAQQAAGLDVYALTGSAKVAYPSEQLIDGVRYLRTPGNTRFNVFGYEQLSRYRSLRRRLSAVVATERPDVIHVHSPVYNGLAALAVARRANIPLVYEVRALWEDAAADRRSFGGRSVFYALAASLESRLLKQADAVVTICNGLSNIAMSRGVEPGKIFVIPNGVNAEELRPVPRDRELAASLGLDDDALVAGFIGSLFAFEGIEDLLDVVPEVLDACPNLRFLIIGNGERQQQIAARAAALGATGRFIYKAGVPHDEVRRYYSLLDCLVYPRRSMRLTEAVTPLKPLEAMAMQKTVVASDIGGHRELVRDGETGVLYRQGSAAALVAALCRVATDPGLRSKLALRGREYVEQERRWDRIVTGHSAVYQRALHSNSLNLRRNGA